MPRQDYGCGPVTRSSAALGASDLQGGVLMRNRAASGKRKEEEHIADGGVKKGRAAFGDLTNQSQGKGNHFSAKESQGSRGSFNGAQQKAPQVDARQHLHYALREFQRPADMELESAAAADNHWIDIDSLDHDDPMACTEYVHDIVCHLLEAEMKRRPCVNYMEAVQQDVNAHMRGILVDWLVEVAQEYKLVSETLFLAVNYIDRFLSCEVAPRRKLQLVGITCMLIAAKYEEIYAPQIEDFCYITDNTYSREEVIAMEQQILGALSFELTVPTAKTFLRRFLKAAMPSDAPADARLEFLSSYLAELMLPEYRALQFRPSQIAASAVMLANLTLGRPAWTPTLQHYTGYSPCDIMACCKLMHKLHAGQHKPAAATPAIRDKYAQPRLYCVSSVAAATCSQVSCLDDRTW
ncbi:Cyclin-A1-2 [Trebouxia sp. C0010 RCD-2024]